MLSFNEFILELKSEETRPDKVSNVYWSNGEVFYELDQMSMMTMGNLLKFKIEKKTLHFFPLDDRSDLKFLVNIQQALKDFIKIGLIDYSWKLVISREDKFTKNSFGGSNDIKSIIDYDSSFTKYFPYLFHGTTSNNLELIKKIGLVPNQYKDKKIHNHDRHYTENSDENIYLTYDFSLASTYASEAVFADSKNFKIKSKPVVIEFKDVSVSSVKSDDDFINGFQIAKLLSSLKGKDIKNDSYIQSLRYSSQIALKGSLHASQIHKIHYL